MLIILQILGMTDIENTIPPTKEEIERARKVMSDARKAYGEDRDDEPLRIASHMAAQVTEIAKLLTSAREGKKKEEIRPAFMLWDEARFDREMDDRRKSVYVCPLVIKRKFFPVD